MDNTRIVHDVVKVYPHMLKIVIYNEPYTLKKRSSSNNKVRHGVEVSGVPDPRSIRRTRQLISDIIACNEFDLWCTFTFNCKKCPDKCKNNPCICDPKTCYRLNPDMCRFRMFAWLRRQKQANPDFKYLIVPEFHKKGGLHFHAFMKHTSARLVDTGKVKNGHKVLKFANYTLGWSHVVDISENNKDGHNAIAQYMQKYITKDMPQFHGKKRYFASQGLVRPESFVNGVSLFNLSRVIRGSRASYINEMFEVQYHPIDNFDYGHSAQSSFSLDVDTVDLQTSRGNPLVFPSH